MRFIDAGGVLRAVNIFGETPRSAFGLTRSRRFPAVARRGRWGSKNYVLDDR